MALEPVEVPGIADAIAVTVGEDHSCALRATGEVWSWGLDTLTGRDRMTFREDAMPFVFPE